MKIFSLVIFFAVGLSSIAFGQKGKKSLGFDHDEVKSMKISHITESVKLTPEEAAFFWPLYNEYEDKLSMLFKERKELDSTIAKLLAEGDEAKFINFLDKITAFDKEQAELKNEYVKRYLTILSPQKVILLYKAEISFRSYLLRKYRALNKDKKE